MKRSSRIKQLSKIIKVLEEDTLGKPQNLYYWLIRVNEQLTHPYHVSNTKQLGCLFKIIKAQTKKIEILPDDAYGKKQYRWTE